MPLRRRLHAASTRHACWHAGKRWSTTVGSWPFSNFDDGELLLMLKDRTGPGAPVRDMRKSPFTRDFVLVVHCHPRSVCYRRTRIASTMAAKVD
jgi:hypothetical protein